MRIPYNLAHDTNEPPQKVDVVIVGKFAVFNRLTKLRGKKTRLHSALRITADWLCLTVASHCVHVWTTWLNFSRKKEKWLLSLSQRNSKPSLAKKEKPKQRVKALIVYRSIKPTIRESAGKSDYTAWLGSAPVEETHLKRYMGFICLTLREGSLRMQGQRWCEPQDESRNVFGWKWNIDVVEKANCL